MLALPNSCAIVNSNETNTKQRELLLPILIVAMVAFIVPQVVTAFAYHRLADHLDGTIKVEVISKE